MNLGRFLETSGSAGRKTVEVRSPRGETIFAGSNATEEEVSGAIQSDAATMPADASHEYVVTTRGDGGSQSLYRHSEHGKRSRNNDRDDVDPATTNTSNAVIGHLTRLVVEKDKVLRDVVKEVVALGMTGMKEARRVQLQLMRTEGEAGLVRYAIEQETRGKAEMLERVGGFADRAFGLLAGALMAKKQLPPAAESAELDDFRKTLTDEQRAKLSEVLGVATLNRAMLSQSADDFARTLLGCSQMQLTAAFGALSQPQAQRLAMLVKPHWDRAQAEAKAAASRESDDTIPPPPPEDETP